ncbi:MAG: histidine kinase [Myxococcaceae bacterium]|nr:histidine kinase [Myxococcaceae bacterium]
MSASEVSGRDDTYTRQLRRRLIIALASPLIVLVTVGGVLALQVSRLSENASWLDHTNLVIAKTYELQKAIIDQETGLRGFLITDQAEFLEPYKLAKPLARLGELSALVSDNQTQRVRLAQLRRRYELWIATAESAIQAKNLSTVRTLEAMRSRKRDMDEIRVISAGLIEAENTLREQRAAALASTNEMTGLILTGLLALAAAAIGLVSRKNLGAVAETFDEALRAERETRARIAEQTWVRTGQMKISEAMQGDRPLEELCARALQALAQYASADVGALFVAEPAGYRRIAGFGLDQEASGPALFKRGEGLVGRAAEDEKPLVLRDVPADFLRVSSGTGQRTPVEVVLAAARTDAVVYAVVELAFLKPIPARVLDLLETAGNSFAVAVRSAEYKTRLRELLEESQRQAEELQTQQEELRVANEELQEQSNALQQAHAQLEERQEELTVTNLNLEERSHDLERAQEAIEEKAAELQRESQYKSEFLANMSHELRTPLNSSLILAGLLANNKDGNLTPEQVKFAQTISMAGNDLLTLINDILDLSKIEAGHMEVNASSTPVSRLVEPIKRMFEPQLADKKFRFSVELADDLPASIETDTQRVQQILKNLISNAFKFTSKGEVRLCVSADADHVHFAVQDTGIGIAEHQQRIVFEAFRQADGTTNRKYGGTGLGLSISRDLARLLGGQLTLTSEVGSGSTFTLSLPHIYRSSPAPIKPQSSAAREAPAPAALPPAPSRAAQARETRGQRAVPLPQAPAPAQPRSSQPFVPDDRDHLVPGRTVLLVVEDDSRFAQILVDLAHESDFQCVVAPTADEGIRLAQVVTPTAVILDMNLPDHSGLSVLDRLKRDPATRHVPVHVVSVEDYAQQALSMGAMGYMLKPVARDDLVLALRKMEERFTTRMRRLLVVEDDDIQRDSICQLLGGPEVETIAVGTVHEALTQLRSSTFDCVVTDLTLPDASGYELLETMSHDENYSFPPVIVYTGRSLTADEEQRLRKHSSSIIVKGARSPERLLDEVTLFLHQVESDMPADRQRVLRQARDREALFEGRRILIVEDDVRNIFALSSVLEPKGAHIIIARNGIEALEKIDSEPDLDLVLMDIMMPEMDGITAMREIRKRPTAQKLPIIALTAKAMKDDQERCMAAGANDYIAKPLDIEMLLSLLRVWMPK